MKASSLAQDSSSAVHVRLHRLPGALSFTPAREAAQQKKERMFPKITSLRSQRRASPEPRQTCDPYSDPHTPYAWKLLSKISGVVSGQRVGATPHHARETEPKRYPSGNNRVVGKITHMSVSAVSRRPSLVAWSLAGVLVTFAGSWHLGAVVRCCSRRSWERLS